MDLSIISGINRSRCDRWHKGGAEWISSDWSNALAGEVGELCNIIKKVRRRETHIDQTYNTPEMPILLDGIKDEVADIFLYLDLVAYYFDLNLEECIASKFNRVSAIQGFPERIEPNDYPSNGNDAPPYSEGNSASMRDSYCAGKPTISQATV